MYVGYAQEERKEREGEREKEREEKEMWVKIGGGEWAFYGKY